MPICQHCQRTWSWTYTLKKMFTFKHSILCPHCKHHQFVTHRKIAKKTGPICLASAYMAPFISHWSIHCHHNDDRITHAPNCIRH